MRDATITDRGRTHTASNSVKSTLYLGQHAATDYTLLDQLLDLSLAQQFEQLVV
jgi:hypothetical protein